MDRDGMMPEDKNARLQLLKTDPDAFFAAAKRVHFRETLDLTGLDFSGLDLSDAPRRRRWDLSGSNLSGCRVNASHLITCRLQGTNLEGVEADDDLGDLAPIAALWAGQDAWHAWRQENEAPVLIGADLSGIDLSGYDLTNVSLSRSLLEGADFRGATLEGTGLTMTSLGGARFDGCSLNRVDMTSATLIQSQFEGATLSLCRLDKADVTGANFQATTWDGCVAKAVGGQGFDASRSIHKQTVLTGASLPESCWNGAILGPVFLEQSDLTGASFTETNVDGAVFLGAEGLNLEGALNIDAAKR